MNTLVTIKNGDAVLRAQGKFGDNLTVGINSHNGDTWVHLRQTARNGQQKSFSIKAEEYIQLMRMVDAGAIKSLDESFEKQNSVRVQEEEEALRRLEQQTSEEKTQPPQKKRKLPAKRLDYVDLSDNERD